MIATLAKAMMDDDSANADAYSQSVALVKTWRPPTISCCGDQAVQGPEGDDLPQAWIYFPDDFGITEVGQIEAKGGHLASRRRAQGRIGPKQGRRCQGGDRRNLLIRSREQDLADAIGAPTAVVLPDQVNGIEGVGHVPEAHWTYRVHNIIEGGPNRPGLQEGQRNDSPEGDGVRLPPRR